MSPPPAPRKFLVIDHNADNRTLLSRTLLRKYPESVVVECQNGDTAVALVRTERPYAVIVHRTADYDGETIVRLLRGIDAALPIVMISGQDRRDSARAAGADSFMDYGAWLTVGNVVAEVIVTRAHREKWSDHGATPSETRAESETI